MFLKDTKTILLALLSFGLVGTWAFMIYEKSQAGKAGIPSVYLKDTAHSGKLLLNDTGTNSRKLNIPAFPATNTTAKTADDKKEKELEAKITEINTLKTDIAALVKKNHLDENELSAARMKIAEMQQLLTQLQEENVSLDKSNSQLTTALNEAGNEIRKWKAQVENLAKVNTPDQIKTGSSFFELSDLRLIPLDNSETNKTETSLASNTEKFSVSFAVKNNYLETPLAELYAVLIQPDGRIYQPDVWDSYSIMTEDGRRKPITQNIKFDYAKGDTRQLNFSISPNEIQRGNYTLQIYQNQKLIGETVKQLK